MISFVYVVLIYMVFNIILFIRFCSFGMIKNKAIIRTFKFPFEILYIHYNLFIKYKKDNLKGSLRLLIYPITNLPNVIVSYAEMYINMDVFERAIKELLAELPDGEKISLIRHLVKKDMITVKTRYKNNDNDDNDINVIPRYSDLEQILT